MHYFSCGISDLKERQSPRALRRCKFIAQLSLCKEKIGRLGWVGGCPLTEMTLFSTKEAVFGFTLLNEYCTGFRSFID